MLNKTGILVAAICLTVTSLPSYAWQAARGSRGGAAVRGPHGNTAAVSRGGAYHHGGGAYYGGYRGGYNNGYSGAAVAGAVVGAAIANSSKPATTVIY